MKLSIQCEGWTIIWYVLSTNFARSSQCLKHYFLNTGWPWNEEIFMLSETVTRLEWIRKKNWTERENKPLQWTRDQWPHNILPRNWTIVNHEVVRETGTKFIPKTCPIEQFDTRPTQTPAQPQNSLCPSEVKYICMRITKNHFHVSGFARSLALK